MKRIIARVRALFRYRVDTPPHAGIELDLWAYARWLREPAYDSEERRRIKREGA